MPRVLRRLMEADDATAIEFCDDEVLACNP